MMTELDAEVLAELNVEVLLTEIDSAVSTELDAEVSAKQMPTANYVVEHDVEVLM